MAGKLRKGIEGLAEIAAERRENVELKGFMPFYWISCRPKPALLVSFPDTNPDYHRRSDDALAYSRAK
jgi:hypothetical protein